MFDGETLETDDRMMCAQIPVLFGSYNMNDKFGWHDNCFYKIVSII